MTGKAVGFAAAALLAAPVLLFTAHAEIDVMLRPEHSTVEVGDMVELGIFAVSDLPDQDQLLAAMELIIFWDPAVLRLLGLDGTGGAALQRSCFCVDAHPLNELDPPQDGDGLYVAWAELGNPVAATPDGTLITTMRFEALAASSGSAVDLPATGGDPLTASIVYDGEIPNLDVTGRLMGAVVVVEPVCLADFNGDGVVNSLDFIAFLNAFVAGDPRADINGDGQINSLDFIAFLNTFVAGCP